MNYLKNHGITATVEMGAKNVLSNLVTANVKGIEAACFGQKENRQALVEYFSAQELKKHASTVVSMSLAAAVDTPNLNADADEYRIKVIDSYRKIQNLQDSLEEQGATPTVEQMQESLELMKIIFEAKKVSAEEQAEWFAKTLDETSMQYVLEGFAV
jgi:[acyl-carrier-protein] S-malonyltransferase